ncbi:hypothetical protein NT05LM_3159 [Listeria marthii FSL S4-120]|uniref:Uncharacterized protein n=1 Tax=Listeria marthii FSL S4-120 TaxID=702457 RepID=A0ABP2JTB2_9LIST|nr:hypothetical protein NT05LM_3159 [Listeria marthii FSL S4-120]
MSTPIMYDLLVKQFTPRFLFFLLYVKWNKFWGWATWLFQQTKKAREIL